MDDLDNEDLTLMPGKTQSLDSLDNEDLTLMKRSLVRKVELHNDLGNNH